MSAAPSPAFPTFDENAAAVAENGYDVLPIRRSQKRPIPTDWCNYRFDQPSLTEYRGAGIGILTKRTPVIDADVRDEKCAAEIAALVEAEFGPAPKRVGQAPKAAWVLQLEGTAFAKVRTRGYRLPGDAPYAKPHMVEILADGQQLVAYNLHPETRRPYRWNGHGEPLKTPTGLLPPITHEKARAFIAKVETILAKYGQPVGKLAGADADRQHAHGAAPQHEANENQGAADPGQLRDALAYIKNADLDYDDWVYIGHAIKGALGDAGRDDFLAWSAQAAKSNPEESAAKWQTFKPSRIGAGTIYYLASQAGWKRHEPAPEIPPLEIPAASTWAEREPPPPRDWICEGLGLPAARVASLIGNGGFGKTTVAAQIMVAVATSRPLWGMPVTGGCVVGFFCEDEQPEIERKIRTISEVEGIALESLDNLHALSRDGEDNVLCSFDHDCIELSAFYRQIDATLERYRPRLTIIDTAADVFAGDFMSTPHVRQFIKVALGGLCKRHETAILLLAHPSAAAMATGDGGGFSTAWNNSVRSRLYLRRPKSDDTEAIADRRVIEIKKANYGPSGGVIPLVYERGRFIFDANPIDEGQAGPRRAIRADTRLSMAVMRYFREHANSGQVVSFGAIFKAMQSSGDLDHTEDTRTAEKVRKQLQRTLKALLAEELIQLCNVPKGYRICAEASE